MGLDDVCNTRLGLGLGFSSRGETKSNSFDNHQSQKGMRGFETLLTLGIRGGDTEIDGHDPLLLCCQDSGTSSNGSVKREREVGSEEGTIEEEDDDGINIARKKLRLNKDQSSVLEENFKLHTTLNPKQKEELARKLNLMPRQIEVWFQNRRARTKLKQTEVDHEYLKNCCKTLTDENRRLHKELQDLKALNISQPYYMQLSTATLSICTSCETISGSDHTTNDQLSVASSKAHFFGPFTNPSATC